MVAFVLTCFICSTYDETSVGTELDPTVLRVAARGGSCWLEHGAPLVGGGIGTNRPLYGAVGAGAARETEALSTGSALITEVAARYSAMEEPVEESGNAADI